MLEFTTQKKRLVKKRNGYFYYRFSHYTSLSGLQQRHIQQLIHKNHMWLFYKLHLLYLLYNIITSINEIIISANMECTKH